MNAKTENHFANGLAANGLDKDAVLKIFEEIKFEKGVSVVVGNLGVIYERKRNQTSDPVLEKQLSQNAFIAGKEFSIADINLLAVLAAINEAILPSSIFVPSAAPTALIPAAESTELAFFTASIAFV